MSAVETNSVKSRKKSLKLTETDSKTKVTVEKKDVPDESNINETKTIDNNVEDKDYKLNAEGSKEISGAQNADASKDDVNTPKDIDAPGTDVH